MMIDGIVYGLLSGWILCLFGIDDIFINGLQDFVSFELTKNHYYLCFAILGCVGNIVQYFIHEFN